MACLCPPRRPQAPRPTRWARSAPNVLCRSRFARSRTRRWMARSRSPSRSLSPGTTRPPRTSSSRRLVQRPHRRTAKARLGWPLRRLRRRRRTRLTSRPSAALRRRSPQRRQRPTAAARLQSPRPPGHHPPPRLLQPLQATPPSRRARTPHHALLGVAPRERPAASLLARRNTRAQRSGRRSRRTTLTDQALPSAKTTLGRLARATPRPASPLRPRHRRPLQPRTVLPGIAGAVRRAVAASVLRPLGVRLANGAGRPRLRRSWSRRPRPQATTAWLYRPLSSPSVTFRPTSRRRDTRARPCPCARRARRARASTDSSRLRMGRCHWVAPTASSLPSARPLLVARPSPR